MNNEDLKIIAEGIGWTNVYIVPSLYPFVLGVPEGNLKEEEFNPLDNASQCMEIMNKLNVEISYPDERVLAGIGFYENAVIGRGETVSEAVCNAALKYFKGMKND